MFAQGTWRAGGKQIIAGSALPEVLTIQGHYVLAIISGILSFGLPHIYKSMRFTARFLKLQISPTEYIGRIYVIQIFKYLSSGISVK